MYLTKKNFTGKKVILRVDFNVPLKNGIIQSTKRIDAVMPTINLILQNNPEQLIIISHLGRPKKFDKNLSLQPIADYINQYYDIQIDFCNLNELPKISKIILLENIRFFQEETKMISTTKNFRKKLSNLADIYINDAFGCCHRNHSSIVGINCSEKYYGLLIKKELKYLKNIFNRKGVKTLILGGSKVNDKIKLINNLIPKVDNILIGGGMAFTFLKRLGVEIGDSIFDKEGFKMIDNILKQADKYNTHICIPYDFVCSNEFNNEGDIVKRSINTGIDRGYMGLDIGINTVTNFIQIIEQSDIIFWNGPLGVFELPNFSLGSKMIMEYLARSNKTSIIGGGDTASCCQKFGMEDSMTHVSTGGGASLELLEGKTLPGLDYLI